MMLKMIIMAGTYHVHGTMLNISHVLTLVLTTTQFPLYRLFPLYRGWREVQRCWVTCQGQRVLSFYLGGRVTVVHSRAEEMADVGWNLSSVGLHKLFYGTWQLAITISGYSQTLGRAYGSYQAFHNTVPASLSSFISGHRPSGTPAVPPKDTGIALLLVCIPDSLSCNVVFFFDR